MQIFHHKTDLDDPFNYDAESEDAEAEIEVCDRLLARIYTALEIFSAETTMDSTSLAYFNAEIKEALEDHITPHRNKNQDKIS